MTYRGKTVSVSFFDRYTGKELYALALMVLLPGQAGVALALDNACRVAAANGYDKHNPKLRHRYTVPG